MKALILLSVLQAISWPTSNEAKAEAEWALFDAKSDEHLNCIKTVSIGFSKLPEAAEIVSRGTWATCIPSWNAAQEQQRKAVQAYQIAHPAAESISQTSSFWTNYWDRRKSELIDEILALVMSERRRKMINVE